MPQPPEQLKLVELDEKRGRLFLPVGEEQTRDFFRSLLGSPQTASKDSVDPFVLSREDISQWYHLICQRISQQNVHALAAVQFKVCFSDGQSIALESLNAFEGAVVTRQDRCVKISIELNFIIRFADKDAPERQSVSAVFAAPVPTETHRMWGLPFEFEDPSRRARASFEVRHTARTWAEDIINISDNFMKQHAIREWGLRSFARRFRLLLSTVLSVSIALGASLLVYQYTSNRHNRILSLYNEIPAPHNDPIIARLDALSQHMLNPEISVILASATALITITPSLIIIGSRMMSIMARQPESFILFSGADEKARVEHDKDAVGVFVLACVSWSMGVVGSIVANVIYALM